MITLCDNRNLACDHASEDLRVTRWQLEISDAGAIQRQWLPGEYNTIADHGSRSVLPNPAAAPDADEAFNSYIYALTILEKGSWACPRTTLLFRVTSLLLR